ncbi:MAG TPA: hypothetical protein VKU00_14620 [Chthonomonadaceae bacterium]|nr:hypothetical protein [Chthonomonadaceae bacterium]
MKVSPLRFVAVSLLLALPLCVQAQNKPASPPTKPPASNAMTCDEALKQAPKDDTSLAPLDKTFKDSEAQLKKSPKDEKVKKTYVEAAYKYGHTVMLDQGKLRPAVQYRAALALYRKALAVDPKHKPSLDDKKTIEDIYTSMHMSIPK